MKITKFFRSDVIRLAMPIVMEQTFTVLMGTINAMMAGHIGKEAISAIGMVDSLNNIVIAFFSSLAVGATVVVAHYIGQGNSRNANEAAKQAMVSGLLLTFLVTALVWIFRYSLIGLLFGAAEPEVIQNTLIYLEITLITYPMITITFIANGVLRGAGDTRTPMQITMMMNIMNIILSYLLIYGFETSNAHFNISIPGLGIRGAAFGIAIARTAGAAILLLVLLRGSKSIRLSQVHRFQYNKEMQNSIFGVGLPVSAESLFFHGGKLATQIFVVGMGTVSIASNQISGNIAAIMLIPGMALGTAATTIIGQNMGRGDKEEAKKSLYYILMLATVLLTIYGALFFPFIRLVAGLYTTNTEIVNLTSKLIRSYILCIPLWAVSFVLPAGLKGAGDARYTMVTTLIGMWAFRITFGYILGVPLKLGVLGIWLGMYSDWVVRGTLYYLRLRSGKWMVNTVIREAKA